MQERHAAATTLLHVKACTHTHTPHTHGTVCVQYIFRMACSVGEILVPLCQQSLLHFSILSSPGLRRSTGCRDGCHLLRYPSEAEESSDSVGRQVEVSTFCLDFHSVPAAQQGTGNVSSKSNNDFLPDLLWWHG